MEWQSSTAPQSADNVCHSSAWWASAGGKGEGGSGLAEAGGIDPVALVDFAMPPLAVSCRLLVGHAFARPGTRELSFNRVGCSQFEKRPCAPHCLCRQMGMGVSICIIIWDKLWALYDLTGWKWTAEDSMCFLTDPDNLKCAACWAG